MTPGSTTSSGEWPSNLGHRAPVRCFPSRPGAPPGVVALLVTHRAAETRSGETALSPAAPLARAFPARTHLDITSLFPQSPTRCNARVQAEPRCVGRRHVRAAPAMPVRIPRGSPTLLRRHRQARACEPRRRPSRESHFPVRMAMVEAHQAHCHDRQLSGSPCRVLHFRTNEGCNGRRRRGRVRPW